MRCCGAAVGPWRQPTMSPDGWERTRRFRKLPSAGADAWYTYLQAGGDMRKSAGHCASRASTARLDLPRTSTNNYRNLPEPTGDGEAHVLLEPGREYTDEEARGLPVERQPQPFDPYALSHPAPGRGQGLKRRSMHGDRWCPFCQTPLGRGEQSCTECRPAREAVIGGLSNRPASASNSSQSQSQSQTLPDDQPLEVLLAAIDEMSRVVGMVSAQQNRGRIKKQHIDEWFFACKDVIVQADTLRRRRTGSP
jgi:hypothetical protein